MLVPINPAQTHEFVPRSERGTDKPTTFILGVPTMAQRCEILDAAASYQTGDGASRGISIHSGTLTLKRLRYGIRGVRNYPAPLETDPDPLGGPRPVPKVSWLETIRADVAQEVADEISELLSPSEEAVGKSEQPSGPQPTQSSEPSAAAAARSAPTSSEPGSAADGSN